MTVSIQGGTNDADACHGLCFADATCEAFSVGTGGSAGGCVLYTGVCTDDSETEWTHKVVYRYYEAPDKVTASRCTHYKAHNADSTKTAACKALSDITACSDDADCYWTTPVNTFAGSNCGGAATGTV